jgi:hypothetical protein
VLERLDDVPWAKLGAVMGPGHSVPEEIRRLLYPDPEARRRALDRLTWILFDEGTPDRVTPAVIPFLIELAAEPAVPDRPDLLRLLARLLAITLGGEPLNADPVSLLQLEEPFEIPEHEARGIEHSPHRACRVNAWRGIAVLERLLSDDDREVRLATGYLLAYMLVGATLDEPEVPKALTTHTIDRLSDAIPGEPDPLVQASQVIALGVIAMFHAEARGRLELLDAPPTSAIAFDPMARAWAGLRRIALGEPLDGDTARRFVRQVLRLDLAEYLDLDWLGDYGSGNLAFDEVEEYPFYGCVSRAIDQLADGWDWIEEIAATGPPAERAHAIRLRNRRSFDAATSWTPADLEHNADFRVRLAVFAWLYERHGMQVAEERRREAVTAYLARPQQSWLRSQEQELRRAVGDALRDGGLGDRMRAAELLARSGSPPRPVAGAIGRERDPWVRLELNRALGDVIDRQTIASLIPSLIAWLKEPIDPARCQERRWIWYRLKAWARRDSGEELLPFLLDWIQDPERIRVRDPERARGAEVYRELALCERALGDLLTELMLRDPDPDVRRAVMNLHGVPAMPAARLLGLENILGAFRDDPEEEVRSSIAGTALGRVFMDGGIETGVAEAIVAALARALEEEASWIVRYGAVNAPWSHLSFRRSEAGRATAIALLIRTAVRDPDTMVRNQAAVALRNVDPGPVGGLAADVLL